MTDRCEIPGCRAEGEIVYLDRGVCGPHWNELMNEGNPPGALKNALGIHAEHGSATENDMAKKKTPETQAPVAADTAPEPKAAPTPARRRKKTPTGDTAPQGAEPAETQPAEPTSKKRAKKTVAPVHQPPTQKEERAPKETLVVFACRVAEHERVKFHEATGPGGATRFARKLMVVFSNEDEAGFRSLIKEARELRA